MKSFARFAVVLSCLFVPGICFAQGPSTYDSQRCDVSAGTGTCGSIPSSGLYRSIFIPSTSTSQQALPAVGVPFYEPEYYDPKQLQQPVRNGEISVYGGNHEFVDLDHAGRFDLK
jgi:hypothetical protein